MEQIPVDMLYLLAEISAVFLGFSIVASSVKREGFGAIRLFGIVSCAAWIMVGVFAPVWLVSYGVSEISALRIAAVLVLLSNGLGWMVQATLPKMREVLLNWQTMVPILTAEATIWISLLVVALNLTTSMGSIYSLGILGLFAQPVVLIIAMIVYADEE